MSAHSVSPSAEGTTCAESTEALAASGMYELSVCQPSLPRKDLKRCSSASRTVPSGFWLLMATAFCSGSGASSSISPKRCAKATCCSSVKCCPGKTRTACWWNAPSTAFQVEASIRASSRSVTTAPSGAAIGVTLGSMGLLLALQDGGRPGRSQGRAMTQGSLDLTREYHDNRAPRTGGRARWLEYAGTGEASMTKLWPQMRTLRSRLMVVLVVAVLCGAVA